MEQYVLPIKVGDVFAIAKNFASNRIEIYGTRYENDKNHSYRIRQTGHTFLKDTDVDGFYKVTNISNVKFDEWDLTENFDIDLELVSPYNWHNTVDPEKFFIDLIKMGFTVISKDTHVCKSRYDAEDNIVKYDLKQERGWLAVSPERGCIISTIEYNKKFDGCYFQFVYPTEETRQKISRISYPISFSSNLEFTVYHVGPMILDVLKDIKISEDIPIAEHISDKPLFTFPFTSYIQQSFDKNIHEYRNIQKEYWQVEKEYNAASRKEFLKLPEKIRDFLWKYTDVNRFFRKRR